MPSMARMNDWASTRARQARCHTSTIIVNRIKIRDWRPATPIDIARKRRELSKLRLGKPRTGKARNTPGGGTP
ncbi:hypothetical protein MIND_00655700 [Mycena indigotica]|uniref:Uncharacterized protein n=1 Tax=Mycena indigotica TaxID=2126181 RepID=A0A8H6SJS8_9AGAR|nr:uncharacterized protein MIND_00655700 [Mycena indigotica]KAF7300928.1 hypothetical protein MIND_00655700 [Mycena indigotica]